MKDEKRNVSVGIGGVVAAGLFMKEPAAVQVQADEAKETVSANNPCMNTATHINSCKLIAGDGQITVAYSVNKFPELPDGSEPNELWFCVSDDTNVTIDDFGDVPRMPPGDSSNLIMCMEWETSGTFKGLTNGKTYHVYANMIHTHTGEGDINADKVGDVNAELNMVHDVMYIGSCTPVAGAGNTSSESTSSAPSTSSSGTGSSAVSGYKAYENKVTTQIEKAQPGSTIVMEKGTTTLSNSVMQELLKKGDVSLRLEFTYNGEEYIIIIPAGAALDNDIPWYGPLYLAQQFGNSAKAEAAPAAGVTYAVKSGDSLNKIAAKNNMTLAELLAKNPQIKDADKISVGQNINL